MHRLAVMYQSRSGVCRERTSLARVHFQALVALHVGDVLSKVVLRAALELAMRTPVGLGTGVHPQVAAQLALLGCRVRAMRTRVRFAN